MQSRTALSGPFKPLLCRVTRTLWRRSSRFWKTTGGRGNSTSCASRDVDGVASEESISSSYYVTSSTAIYTDYIGQYTFRKRSYVSKPVSSFGDGKVSNLRIVYDTHRYTPLQLKTKRLSTVRESASWFWRGFLPCHFYIVTYPIRTGFPPWQSGFDPRPGLYKEAEKRPGSKKRL